MKLFVESSYVFIDKELDVKFCARVNKGNNEIAPSAEISDVNVYFEGRNINDTLDRLNSIIECRIDRMRKEGKLICNFNIWDEIWLHIIEEIS